ncbi:MAG: NAD(P)/FAD-dependent oxidoreductase [Acidimicrobiia bacterium]|nr:NAD(P)/FAD-dependent oxidoreductase [Acidimicrobiia bacterium]
MSSTDSTAPAAHVIVVGGGFGGVACAKQLGKRDVDVTLIDKHTYHQFQPLLYQVATAQLAADDVRMPLRDLFRKHRTVVVKNAEVTAIDPALRSVTTADGVSFTGDHLVLAMGSRANYFGVPGAEEHSFPLYTSDDAVLLRDRLLRVFEDADLDPGRIDQGALNFVVIGAGPTGVETAGALADLVDQVMPDYYHDLDVGRARIIIVDRSNVVLRPFSEKAHDYAAKVLERKGVTLRLESSVQEVRSDRVVLDDGSEILTHCAVWAGGLQSNEIAGLDVLPKGRRGRIQVGEHLEVDGFDAVYAIGDAALTAGGDGDPLPQLGAVALQAGAAAADSILAEIDGRRAPSFKYHDKGIMAMIGRRSAIAEVGAHHHELHGAIAFGAWLGVHAWLLNTTRTRIDTFVAWGWDWFTHSRSSANIGEPEVPRIDWSHDDRDDHLDDRFDDDASDDQGVSDDMENQR